jgi:copper chaperone CopZ
MGANYRKNNLYRLAIFVEIIIKKIKKVFIMKKIVIHLAVFTISLFFIQTAVFAQKKNGDKVVKLQTSAHTEMCKAKIEKTLAYEKGIVKSELDRETQILTVTYKPKKTDVGKIIKVIISLGHDAKEIVEVNCEGSTKQEVK